MENLPRVLRAWSRGPDRGVIFDFNGTLSDDEPILRQIFTELFAEHLGWQMPAEDYVARLAGYSDREIIERVVTERAGDPALVEPLLAERRRRYRELVRTESPVRPDTCALVARLAAAGVPMAIVTGAQRPDVELVLAHSEVGRHLDLMVTEEDVIRGKPDPECFLKGAALLGLDPAAVLVLEDSVAGVRAARAAGMAVVGVEGTGARTAVASVADATVPALSPGLLDAVPGWPADGSSGLDAGAQRDPGAVGAEQVERALHR